MKRNRQRIIVVLAALLLLSAQISGVRAADTSAAIPAAAAQQQGAAVKDAGTTKDAKAPGEGKDAKAPGENKDAAAAKAGQQKALTLSVKFPIDSPLFSKTPVAAVNDEPILLDELMDAETAVHMAARSESGGGSMEKSLSEVLKRLITIRLFVLEAENIGLDQLPEVKDALKTGKEQLLRETLYRKLAREVKLDTKSADKLYKSVTKQVKLSIVEFVSVDAATKFRKAVNEKNFDELTAQAVKDGVAKARQDGAFTKNSELVPEIANKIEGLEVGKVTPVVAVKDHYLVVRVREVKYEENQELKDASEYQILDRDKSAALKKRRAELIKKYMKQNTKLIKKLDFEAKTPGMEKLLKDKRVIVAVKGGKETITVADLAQGLNDKFYHGVKLAADEKKVNRAKQEVLEEMMAKLAFNAEAKALAIDKSEDYLKALDKMQKSMLFGLFVEKVIRPEVKGNESDFQAYYKAHASEYTYPAMVSLDAIAFAKSSDAKAAQEKLRQGMDLHWLKQNAEGLADKDSTDMSNFDPESYVSMKQLPDGIQKALEKAKSGEYRLYETDAATYVIYVQNLVPERQQALDEVRERVARSIYGEVFQKIMDGWMEKLQKAYTVKLFIDEDAKKAQK